MAVRALFSLCAPVRLLERLFHTRARVWRYFFYTGDYTENMFNFEANSVSKWYFSLFGVSLVNNFQKMALFDARLFIGRQNREKNCSHVSTFFHFFSVEMCFYKCKMLLNTNLSTFLPILYAKFNTQKCARLWRALVRLFTPVCATFWKIIWQHWHTLQTPVLNQRQCDNIITDMHRIWTLFQC